MASDSLSKLIVAGAFVIVLTVVTVVVYRVCKKRERARERET